MKKILLILIISSIHLSTFSQDHLESPKVLDFFHEIYAYDFAGARELLDEILTEHRGTPSAFLCEANYYWWLMMTGLENDHTRSNFERANQSIIDLYAAKEPSQLSPDEIFSVIHGYAYQTRYALHYKRYLQGISNLNKIMPFLEVVLKNPDLNPKYKLLAGLYHYSAAVTREERPFLRPFFSLAPASNKDLGYRLLEEAASCDHPLIKTEGSYFLMKTNLEIAENIKESIRWSRHLVKAYPDNILYRYYLLTSYSEGGFKRSSQQENQKISDLSNSLPGLKPAQRKHFPAEAEEILKKMRW